MYTPMLLWFSLFKLMGTRRLTPSEGDVVAVDATAIYSRSSLIYFAPGKMKIHSG